MYYVKDKLGSVIGLFDENGARAGGYAYSPYGERRNSVTGGSIADINSLRYISGYADRSANGIYKLGARYYDPTLGRFTSYDPSGQEKNPMAYAKCNPLSTSDPSGELSQTVQCGLAFVGIATLLAVVIAGATIATAGAATEAGALAYAATATNIGTGVGLVEGLGFGIAGVIGC